MLNTIHRRRAGAGLLTGALVASALLLAPTAQAATEVTVKNSDVLTSETPATYTSWHQGYNNPTGARVTSKGLELSNGPSQVIKGYADNNETIAPGQPNFDIAAKITGSTFTATDGVATLQVPLRSTAVSAAGNFTTLYSMPDKGSQVKTSDLWASTAAIGTGPNAIPAGTPVPLTAILGQLQDYKVIGFGVQANANATISTLTWDGVTYRFKDQKLKGKVEIYRINPPSKISVRRTVSLYATVKVDGKAAPRGTTVYGYAKGKKVITGKVNSSGKVKLTLPVKLPAGKSTLKVTQAGSSKLNGGSDSVVVRVRK